MQTLLTNIKLDLKKFFHQMLQDANTDQLLIQKLYSHSSETYQLQISKKQFMYTDSSKDKYVLNYQFDGGELYINKQRQSLDHLTDFSHRLSEILDDIYNQKATVLRK